MRYARAVASSSPVARTRSSTNCVTAASVGAPWQRGVVARSVALASGTGQAEVWRQRLYLCISSMHLCVNLSCAAKLICALTRLDVHRVVVLEEHDAHLPQAPPRQLFVLWRDIGSQGHRGDGTDQDLVVVPHRPTGGDLSRRAWFSLGCLGQPFRCDCVGP